MRRALILTCALLIGCAPSVSPLYRDFAPAPPTERSVEEPTSASGGLTALPLARADRALRRADWTPQQGPYDAPVLRTEARTVGNVGLYRTEITLEVVPLSEDHVRVYVHPYRRYLIGGRSKLPYLNPSLRRTILPELEAAFEAEGLQMLGTARKRDEAGT